MGYIAPAGTPIGLRDLATVFSPGDSTMLQREFEGLLARRLDGRRTMLFSSARAGLASLLRALADGDPSRRKEVVLPAYTCYSVAAAVVRAGLHPRLCDLDPATLDYTPLSLARIDPGSTLAILSANLYGIPNDLAALEEFAAQRDIHLIDDAAQAFGATFSGRPVGGFGAAGLISFDKGKNITTVSGGAVVTRSATVSDLLARAAGRLPPPRFGDAASSAARMPLISIGLQPAVYDLVRRLPGLGLGVTTYDPGFAIRAFHPRLARLGLRMLSRLDNLNANRNAVAAGLRSTLPAGCVRFIAVHDAAAPTYTRFPLLSRPEHRNRLVDALNDAGIGATASYPQALCDVQDLRPQLRQEDLHMPGARTVAASMVTLPTHAYCTGDYVQKVASIVERITA